MFSVRSWIGETLERDAEVLAHDAARALAADKIAPGDRLRLAGRIDDMRHHAVGILREARKSRRQPQVDAGMRFRQLERFLDDLDALALQHIGKARVVLEVGVIECGDQLVLGAGPNNEIPAR